MPGGNRSRSIVIAIFALSAVRIGSYLLATWRQLGHRVTGFDLWLHWIIYPEELISIHTPLGHVNPPLLFVVGFTCLILLDSILIVFLISQVTTAVRRVFAAPR